MKIVKRKTPPLPTEPLRVVDHGLVASTVFERGFVDAFLRLYARLCDFAARFVGRDSAEDAVQDAFIDLWKRYKEEATEPLPDVFYFRSVRFNALDVLRKAHDEDVRAATFAQEHASRVAVCGDPAAHLMERTLAEWLDDAIDKLPPRCREVWLLVHEQGFSGLRAAEILGLDLKTVSSHACRAYEFLSEWAERDGYPRDMVRTRPRKLRALAAPES